MKERLNSKKGKYLKSLFFVAMFVSIAYMVGLIAEAKGIKLSYDMVKQQKTNWCWAASAENSVRYEMKNPRTQKSAVNKIKGTTRDAYPNVGGTLSDIKKAAVYISRNTESYFNSSLSRSSVKSFDCLKKEVSSGNVTILVAGYYNGSTRTGGHAVTMIGYDITGGKNYLQIYDPWDGTINKCTYSNFKSGFGNRQYDGTVWNQE